MKIIGRNLYLDRLISVKNVPDMKIITGVRRSGKSELLNSFSSYLKGLDEKENIIRVNLRDRRFKQLKDGDALYDYVSFHYVEGVNNYLLIDEIQETSEFEEVINSLHDEFKYDIYITGSNAFLLSSDLATLFGGRYVDIDVYPFSFKEFKTYFDEEKDERSSFKAYLRKGGLAGSYLYENYSAAMRYVRNVARTTIIRDIVQRYKVENEPLLNLVVDFLCDNVGSKTSLKNIANVLTGNGFKTNDMTIAKYVSYLEKSYFVYPCTRYDIRGKRYLQSDKKYYLADHTFKYALLGSKNEDYGHIFENIVYLELLRRGYEVYVGCLYDKEVDFVAVKNGEKTYIQVAYRIDLPDIYEREIRVLRQIKDAYPKMIIADTAQRRTQDEGIQIVDIVEWLSE